MSDPTDPAKDDEELTFLQKYLSCPVCLAMYTKDRLPRFLPCGHTFCSTCIPKFLENSTTCATCRAPVPGGKDQEFPINFQVNGMIGVKDLPKTDTAEELEKKWRDVDIATDNMMKVARESKKQMEELYQRMHTFIATHEKKLKEMREKGTRKEVLVVTEERIRSATAIMCDEQQQIKKFCKYMSTIPPEDYFVSKKFLKRKLEPSPEEMKEYYDRLVDRYLGENKDAQMAFARNVRKSMEELQSQMDRYFPKELIRMPAAEVQPMAVPTYTWRPLARPRARPMAVRPDSEEDEEDIPLSRPRRRAVPPAPEEEEEEEVEEEIPLSRPRRRAPVQPMAVPPVGARPMAVPSVGAQPMAVPPASVQSMPVPPIAAQPVAVAPAPVQQEEIPPSRPRQRAATPAPVQSMARPPIGARPVAAPPGAARLYGYTPGVQPNAVVIPFDGPSAIPIIVLD